MVNSRIEADVCIVGAGFAGLTAAPTAQHLGAHGRRPRGP